MRALALVSWFAIVVFATILGLELVYGEHERGSVSSDATNNFVSRSTSTPRPTLTPLPTRFPTKVPTPTSIPTIPGSDQRYKLYLLELINKDRRSYGLEDVTLGSNRAAQDHAEVLLEAGITSHWGLDGLKPYMRYTLAGGYNYSSENVRGSSKLLKVDCNYKSRGTVQTKLDEAQAGFMNSPGHKTNILNPWHKKVNLGIACDKYGCTIVQLFEGDYVIFSKVPTLVKKQLSFSGSFKTGVIPSSSSILITYDELPSSLTVGQLQRTYSYTTGQEEVALVRPPVSSRSYYAESHVFREVIEEVDPYEVSPDISVLVDSCSSFPVVPAFKVPILKAPIWISVPWVTADSLKRVGSSFEVVVDLGTVMQGPGIYTVLMWGEKNGISQILIEYPIWVKD